MFRTSWRSQRLSEYSSGRFKSKPCVAIDSGVFVSALMHRESVPAKAVSRAWSECKVVYSLPTLEELAEVLTRSKFERFFTDRYRLNLLALIEQEALLVDVTDQVSLCRDPKDDKFLSLIMAAKADLLMTGEDR